MGTTTPTLSGLEFFPQKILSVKNKHKCIQLSILIWLVLIVKALSGVLEKSPIVVDEDLSFAQQPTSPTLVFDSVKKYYFLPLNDSNSFRTVDHDARINTKIDGFINHVLKPMSVKELNKLHHICQLERAPLLTILAMFVQNPQLTGYLLTGNRSNFLYVEGFTAWLNDCPQFFSPRYENDKVLIVNQYTIKVR